MALLRPYAPARARSGTKGQGFPLFVPLRLRGRSNSGCFSGPGSVDLDLRSEGMGLALFFPLSCLPVRDDWMTPPINATGANRTAVA